MVLRARASCTFGAGLSLFCVWFDFVVTGGHGRAARVGGWSALIPFLSTLHRESVGLIVSAHCLAP